MRVTTRSERERERRKRKETNRVATDELFSMRGSLVRGKSRKGEAKVEEERLFPLMVWWKMQIHWRRPSKESRDATATVPYISIIYNVLWTRTRRRRRRRKKPISSLWVGLLLLSLCADASTRKALIAASVSAAPATPSADAFILRTFSLDLAFEIRGRASPGNGEAIYP